MTQVLGELEFSVESCVEPFAAVKRLMGEHFDAVVVDCDNEQNATLLFKSARNSTSNQASLAVAVVEGQAGVAKAFRIGANLVLTKPINIEQSKGTLRVARGLLRKGEPAKPGAAAPTAPTPAATAPKPVPPRPVPVAKPAAPAQAATPRPAAPIAKPAAAPPLAATASSIPAAHNANKPPATAPEVKSPLHTASPAPTFSGGAASAPAPAREAQIPPVAPHIPEASPAATISQTTIGQTTTTEATTNEAAIVLDQPAEAAEGVHSDAHGSASASTFTFGGANAPVESNAGRTKIFMAIAAVVLVAAGLYAGWNYFQGRATQPAITSTTTAPVSTPQIAKPASAVPKPALTPSSSAASTSAASTAATSTSPISQPAAQPPADKTTATGTDAGDADSTPETTTPAASTKPTGKAAKSEAAPLVVKGGSAPAVHTKPAASDAPAPSMIGMAVPGSSAPPPNLVNATSNEPKPVLQTLNVSQGVSQGLLIKKVQPFYPRNALSMHVEGAVELMATISTSGNITAVKVLSGDQLLTRAAVDAVKQWKYKPYLLNAAPVEIQTQITVNFKLPH